MKKQNEKIISYEFGVGWPIYKMSVRDIIENLGGKLNQETGMYEIKDDKSLDVFPLVVEDDGMGYGVNEQYIQELYFYRGDEKPYCTIFREGQLECLDQWKKYHIFPGMEVVYNDADYYINKIMNIHDNQYQVELVHTEPNKTIRTLIDLDKITTIIEKMNDSDETSD